MARRRAKRDDDDCHYIICKCIEKFGNQRNAAKAKCCSVMTIVLLPSAVGMIFGLLKMSHKYWYITYMER